MKILYILDYFYPYVGGVPTVFLNLAKEMISKGHDVTIVTSRGIRNQKFENYQGIKIYRLGKNRRRFLIRSILFLLKTKEIYDIIHTSTYSAMFPSYVYSRLKNIPRVVTIHEVWSLKEWLEFYSIRGLLYYLQERLLLSLHFNFYFSPSLHTKNDMVKVGLNPEKIEVIYHGINKNLFSPDMKKFRTEFRKQYNLPQNRPIGLFIGKATKFKGIDYILPSINSIIEKQDIKFIFLLSKSYKKEYDQFVKNIQSTKILRDSIIILEPQKEHDFVAKLIGACDFLIMPSLTEGFGFAAAEAASVGIPSIVTRNTSLGEIVDSKNSLLIDSKNSQQLTDAIHKLLDEKIRNKLSVSKTFENWKDVSEKYEKYYKKLVI